MCHFIPEGPESPCPGGGQQLRLDIRPSIPQECTLFTLYTTSKPRLALKARKAISYPFANNSRFLILVEKGCPYPPLDRPLAQRAQGDNQWVCSRHAPRRRRFRLPVSNLQQTKVVAFKHKGKHMSQPCPRPCEQRILEHFISTIYFLLLI